MRYSAFTRRLFWLKGVASPCLHPHTPWEGQSRHLRQSDPGRASERAAKSPRQRLSLPHLRQPVIADASQYCELSVKSALSIICLSRGSHTEVPLPTAMKIRSVNRDTDIRLWLNLLQRVSFCTGRRVVWRNLNRQAQDCIYFYGIGIDSGRVLWCQAVLWGMPGYRHGRWGPPSLWRAASTPPRQDIAALLPSHGEEPPPYPPRAALADCSACVTMSKRISKQKLNCNLRKLHAKGMPARGRLQEWANMPAKSNKASRSWRNQLLLNKERYVKAYENLGRGE